MSKSYSELITIPDYYERFDYLKLYGGVGEIKWGGSVWLKNRFYSSPEWQRVRRHILIRDGGLDLAHSQYPIKGNVYIHHINPVTLEMIANNDPLVYSFDNLISVSFDTHQAIHYGDRNLLPSPLVERRPGDTCPWRKMDEHT